MRETAATVADTVLGSGGAAVIVCDVSPPRGGDAGALADAAALDADFLSVSYNPNQSVRVNAAITAAHVQDRLGKRAIFSHATRDMNRIATQSLLLGASWMGLRNVVVLRGDPIMERDRARVRAVNDYTTTGLLSDVARMNSGHDFRGLELAAPTSFCAGAVVDLALGPDAEIALAARKLAAGAEFLLFQAHFDASVFDDARRRLAEAAGDGAAALFAGVQFAELGGIDFGNVPDSVYRELASGRTSMDIAMELSSELWARGVRTFYVVPPIERGGRRDYGRAAELVRHIRGLEKIA